ncbi:MAG: hypothetical protein V1781_02015 [Bacteroidota bacterium]
MRKRKKTETKNNNNPVNYPEIQISSLTNTILRWIMKIDELCYDLKIKLPFGGSILLVATKE